MDRRNRNKNKINRYKMHSDKMKSQRDRSTKMASASRDRQDQLARRRKILREKRELRNKARNRRLIGIFTIIAVIVLAVVFIFTRRSSNNSSEVKNSGKITDGDSGVNNRKPIKPEASLEEKTQDFNRRIRTFIKDNKLDKGKISIAYYNLDKGDALSYNDDIVYRMGRSNDFMLGILLYDMEGTNGINLDERVNLIRKENKGKKNKKDKKKTDENQENIDKSYTIRGLIKLMVQVGSDEARQTLAKYIEDKTSKYWYDALSDIYKVQVNYKNEMSQKDAMVMIRRLFNQRDLTLEERARIESGLLRKDNEGISKERIKEETKGKVFTYQELINFMAASRSDASIDPDLVNKALFSENYGEDYGDRSLLGYVLGEDKYLYLILTKNTSKDLAYKGLSMVNDFHDYYN